MFYKTTFSNLEVKYSRTILEPTHVILPTGRITHVFDILGTRYIKAVN